MFGWLRKVFKSVFGPEGPVTFDFEVEIDAAPEQIYALLDFADPRNAKRQLGHSLTQLSTGPETWKLVIAQMPDATFFETVTEAKSPTIYAYRSMAEPQQGAMVWADERWSIAPRGGAPALVTLLVEVQFVEPMLLTDYQQHVAMMAQACQITVDKLKLHAEEGLEAVRAFEAQQFA